MRKIVLLLLGFVFLFGYLCGVSQAATSTSDVEPGERLVITGTCADTANELVKSGTFFIEAIYWYNPTTVAHVLEFLDGDGDMVATLKCVVATQSMVLYPKTIVRGGLYVDLMESGTVVIFYRNIDSR